MTVQELMDELAKCPPDMPVAIAVQAYTQVYPAGYFEPWKAHKAHDETFRIYTTLPEGFIISERKNRHTNKSASDVLYQA